MTGHAPANDPHLFDVPFQGGDVVEVPVLMLESQLRALQELAAQDAITTGQLLRRVIARHLMAETANGNGISGPGPEVGESQGQT